MIRLYKNYTGFAYLDFVSVEPSKAEIHWSNFLECYCDLEIPADKTTSDYFKQDGVFFLQTPWGEQPFRITNPERSDSLLRTRAYQVCYDLKNYIIETQYGIPPSSTFYNLMQMVLGNSGASGTFSPYGNPTMIKPLDYGMMKIDAFSTAYDALMWLADYHGVQLLPNGFYVVARNYPTTTNPDFILKNNKNIVTIDITENWDNVVTKLIATGAKETTPPFDPATVTINSAKTYNRPYEKKISFEPSKGVDKTDTQAVYDDLETQAGEYLAKHEEPEKNLTIDAFYGDYRLHIGDQLKLIYEPYGVDIVVSIISVDYNALTGQYTKVELGNHKPTITSFAREVKSDISNIKLRLTDLE